jgi:hypothetical protein
MIALASATRDTLDAALRVECDDLMRALFLAPPAVRHHVIAQANLP